MGDKEPIRFHYDTYPTLASNQTTTAGIVTSSIVINNTNNGTNSLKRGVSGVIGVPDAMTQVGNVGVVGGGGQSLKLQQTSGKHKTNNIAMSSSCNTRRTCCACMGSKSASFWAGLLTNLGICTLLFAYTLLGSFIFLAIEGGASTMQQRTLASTNRHHHNQLVKPIMRLDNVTFSSAALQDALEARQRIVENIWDITVSLNILYRENWTRLAALEIARFQDQLIKRLTDDMSMQLEIANNQNQQPSMGAVMIPQISNNPIDYDWTFARAFLYSLTVLTTIGYGSIAPKTTLGRVVTLAYALLGIPLTLVYLSSTGGVLARVARGVFSRALCCCLCSNCGYCCYDEKRMAEKERRMKRKRQQEEFRAQQLALQEPYYVRSGSLHNNLHSPEKQIQIPEIDSLSASESRTSMHGLSLLAPILLCLCMMIIYIVAGAIALYRLEGWPLLDGIYFCFMSLSTIGFGDLVPGLKKESTTTIWFCSIYIMSGMALTAMCFNVLHEEILHRLKHVSSNLNDKNNLSLVIDKNNASSTTISSHQMKSKNFNDSSDSEYLGS